MTLHEYLAASERDILSLDLLILANKFFCRGVEVILVNMPSVLDRGYSISNVIVCDVLGAECTSRLGGCWGFNASRYNEYETSRS